MQEPRFKIGDKVRIVRVFPAVMEDLDDDMSEAGYEELLSALGEVFVVKVDPDILSGERGSLYMYEREKDSFYEGELDFA